MPDTTFTTHHAQRRNHLLAEWDDVHKPALDWIETTACAFLHALDQARADLTFAADIKLIDAMGCDFGGLTLDLIASLAGTQRKELDDCGGDVEQMRIVTDVLEEEHALWTRRWNARRAA